MSTTGKVITWTSLVAVLVLSLFIFFKFCFVYAEGVNEGDINYFQKEGFIFKTYEGKMIQTGLKNTKVQGSIQSNEFKFSVVNESVAKQLERCTGKMVELHYKEYLGTLPWRGVTKYVVDSVYSVSSVNEPVELPVAVPTEVL